MAEKDGNGIPGSSPLFGIRSVTLTMLVHVIGGERTTVELQDARARPLVLHQPLGTAIGRERNFVRAN